MSRRAVLSLVMAAILLHAWAILQWRASPLRAVGALRGPAAQKQIERLDPVSPADKEPGGRAFVEEAPAYREEFISPPISSGIVHAASLCELPGGKLAASWYGGSKEAAPDVVIYFSVREPEEASLWSPPRVIADAASASRELARYVRKVGNGLLFLDGAGRLCLLYTSMPAGGWSACSLNIKTSSDGGSTWSRSQRLTLSPFFNISQLVRNGPAPFQAGFLAIPIYHECLSLFSEWLVMGFEPSGKGFIWRKARIPGTQGLLQPAVAVYGSHKAKAFFRSSLPSRAVAASMTEDGGSTWSSPGSTSLPNPNSAISVLVLPSGKTLMAFNDSTSNRECMRLAVSDDEGSSWKRIATTDEEPGSEFSYPFLIQDGTGFIHLAYTWKRERIKLVSFNQAWIEMQEAKGMGNDEPGSGMDWRKVSEGAEPSLKSIKKEAEKLAHALKDEKGLEAPASKSLSDFKRALGLKAFPFLLMVVVIQAALHAGGKLIRCKHFPISPSFCTAAAVALSFLLTVAPLGGLSIAEWMIGFNAVYSIPLFALLIGRILKTHTGSGLFSSLEQRTIWAYGLISGLVLYVPFLGMDRIDPYALGFGSGCLSLLLLGTTVVLLGIKNRFGAVLVAVIAAYDLNLLESANLWDYMIDPILTIVSAGALITGSQKWFFRQRLQSSGN